MSKPDYWPEVPESDRYVIFGPFPDSYTLLIGCEECDEPLVEIDLERGPDNEIGDILREHERTKHSEVTHEGV
jgi:hypothetical protein